MNRAQRETLSELADGNIRFSCSMAEYTTFRVGGKIEALVTVEKVGRLRKIVPFLEREDIPRFVLGRGSNLLVMDGDIPGVAIQLKGPLAAVEEDRSQEAGIAAGAGASLDRLLHFCRTNGFGGAEFLAGIPGTVGGAAVMNTGAFGQEIGALIAELEMITPRGELLQLNRDELCFSYRKLEVPEGQIVTRALLEMEKSTALKVGEKINEYLGRRKKTQPLHYPSAGSVFKNPPGEHAGRLLEEAGLKGKKCGGAMISTKHANWIVNTGGATARDILDLIGLARERVIEKRGIELDLEIKVIGR
ncbi:MAG: UDP-N-acetylenolpyruvoylglucosamine reductase [Thermoplasmata archaeon]|nr:MAG: UDP-N-acetylenolpyruvoylglucosamine reductase [Thermoplasmata archaeon]